MRPPGCGSVNSWRFAGTTSTSRDWRFGHRVDLASGSGRFARRKHRPSPSQWTVTWRKICSVGGAKSVPDGRAIGSLPVRRMKGKQPYWPDNLMKRYIKPVAQQSRHQQEHRLAHFPPFLRHVAEGERGGCEDRTGALTARQQQDHAGRLHAGSELEQASRTEQGCKDDGVERGSKQRKNTRKLAR